MKSIPAILSPNFIARDVIQELRIKLACQDPEEAIQLLIALFQDQRIVAPAAIAKCKDQQKRKHSNSYHCKEYRCLHDLPFAFNVQLVITQVHLIELFNHIDLKHG